MKREELREILRTAPHIPGTRTRIDHLGQKTGQLFGWIAGPDQQFINDWLPDIALDYVRPMRIVEVGTFAGSTARGLIVFSGGGTITCIDNMTDVHQEARGNFPTGRAFWEHVIANNGANLSSYATLIEGDSADIGRRWIDVAADPDIDLLFIDGDHAEEPAHNDMNLYACHVVPGGYCLVDDYDMPAVERACIRYFHHEHRDEWRVVHRPNGSTAKIIAYQRQTP